MEPTHVLIMFEPGSATFARKHSPDQIRKKALVHPASVLQASAQRSESADSRFSTSVVSLDTCPDAVKYTFVYPNQ